ncbi:MAG: hypothetical protein ABI378_12205 [Chitinophagaceae bacterium]
MQTRFLLVPCLILLAFCSCTKYTDTHCVPGGYRCYFVGFDTADITQVIHYRYPKGQNFQNLIDSTVITTNYQDQTLFFHFGDTLAISGWSPEYDWRIVALPINEEWRVSDIAVQDLIHHDRPSSPTTIVCPLGKYKVNGMEISGGVFTLLK